MTDPGGNLRNRLLALAIVIGVAFVAEGITMLYIGIWTDWRWAATGALTLLVGTAMFTAAAVLDDRA